MCTLKPSDQYPGECQKIVDVCQRLYQKNMLAAADGNVSVRVAEGVLITPSGQSKAFISKEDIGLVTLDNQIFAGNPSSERLMHLEVYNTCSQASAVVHAHPPCAIAWTVAFPEMTELPNNCLSEVILATGSIPMVPYARPGTKDMGHVLREFLPDHKVMILSRHGGLCWGDSLEEAVLGMERLEHSAEILYRAQTLKGLTFIDESEMQELQKMREKIGNRTL